MYLKVLITYIKMYLKVLTLTKMGYNVTILRKLFLIGIKLSGKNKLQFLVH